MKKFRISGGLASLACMLIPAAQAEISVLTPEVQVLMQEGSSAPLVIPKRPSQPHTSFHTQTGYLPEYDIRTDAVIIYNRDKENYDSWKAHGYDTQTMYCFREDQAYLDRHPGTGQTDAKGRVFKVGEGRCYYFVPTQERINAAVAYFDEAIKNGSTAVVPEEPEYFAEAGYSAAFKQEWRDHYGEPWRDPASSIEARWKSERLKAGMEHRMLKAILDGAKAKKPSVKRMVAIHSPLHYYSYGLIFPYHQLFKEKALQELIAQVWTGTARVPTRLEGKLGEHVFEWGYLEYSSLYNLMRNSGKRLWFFMDPLEDNLDRGIGDYQENYEKTLIASLLFPEIDEYEVMPWPTRIYGKVPDWFTTKMGTVVNVLNDMHRQKDHELYAGTPGIATFVADSMGWQRAKPSPSDFEGFHGLTLPLISRGVPVQVAQFERSVERGYLDRYHVLLLSYDLFKPMSGAENKALAAWVKRGGTLIVTGGSDPYDELDEWWKKAGHDSPRGHLFAQLGLKNAYQQTVRIRGKAELARKASENALTARFPQLNFPSGLTLTSSVPAATPLYRQEGETQTLVFQKKLGRGHVIVSGIAPRYFASSPQAAAFFRALVAYGSELAGVPYREAGYMGVRRGKYVAVQAQQKSFPLHGSYVDLFSRDLGVKTNPIVPAKGRGLWADVGAELKSATPRILISSDRIEARVEGTDLTSVLLTGPLRTQGATRVSRAGREPASIEVLNAQGQLQPHQVEGSGESILVRYASQPQGAIVKIHWKSPRIEAKSQNPGFKTNQDEKIIE